MSVNKINEKIQSKIHELENFADKFRAERDLIQQSARGSAARMIQVKSYIARIELEIKFLNEISIDLENEVETNVGTVSGDDEYAEDMGDVEGEEDEYNEEEDDENDSGY